MKTLVSLLVILLASSWSAYGRAYFFTRSELIENSSAIAIIVVGEPEPAKPVGENRDPFAAEDDGASGKVWTYSEQANVRVEKVLKGDLPDEFILYGHESYICAHCPLAKGRFLAFLSKDGELWVGANWQLSLRPIKEDQVEWYISEDQRYPMKFQKLDDVLKLVSASLQRQSEHGSAGQPATRSKSVSEAGDKPQPESEGRSR
ncbi:hypothetical protein JIN85_18335 [Luteolibacter pohnpeiensis]|uniref:Uncharacterized protein n=1 Tax=Luteolibacter pohnpeiensis TaxID=454153 RepID=A0A934SE03_9BACT|nr:hypothetical protein [Luteolibacter pohnpeiensis]MBK1884382.1 hypothetical protein [Luteolibacter pohnpeiensis]